MNIRWFCRARPSQELSSLHEHQSLSTLAWEPPYSPRVRPRPAPPNLDTKTLIKMRTIITVTIVVTRLTTIRIVIVIYNDKISRTIIVIIIIIQVRQSPPGFAILDDFLPTGVAAALLQERTVQALGGLGSKGS